MIKNFQFLGYGFFVEDKLYKGKIFPNYKQAEMEAISYERWKNPIGRTIAPYDFNQKFNADIRKIYSQNI